MHSYLAYLRDPLIVAKELLSDRVSIFVQIGDENVHHVREVMDDLFGAQNFTSIITVQKTTSASGNSMSTVADFVLWYARNKETVKVRPLYLERSGLGG